jgi:hypothetical protein
MLFFSLIYLFVISSQKMLFGSLICILILLFIPPLYLSIILDRDGVWNPSTYYQRYRAEEYSSKRPFFQWWYYSLKDYRTNRTFALCYSVSRPSKDKTYSGVYMMFAMVSPTERFHIYYRFPWSDLERNGDYNLNIRNGLFLLTAKNGDKYSLKGTMHDPTLVWTAEGIDKSVTISWDLNVSRIVGWYGQQDIEPMVKQTGVISWNTYAYDSEVQGTITINGTTYQIERTPQFRMYCDMNWGENFPSTKNPKQNQIDYPWGWYYTGVPNADPTQDVAIIAGVGRSDTNICFSGDMYAKFASIYIRGEKWSARLGQILHRLPDRGLTPFFPSPDGKTKKFTVERSNWVEYQDIFGVARIPLLQIVTIETTHKRIILTFSSRVENYNRLLFPTDGYIFSDFEGLGVHCKTEIFQKEGKDFKLKDVIEDHNAGLEYGYKLPFKI